MNSNNLKRVGVTDKKAVLAKITTNLIQLNQISKLEMANSLLEETIQQTSNSIKKFQYQKAEDLSELKKENIKIKEEIRSKEDIADRIYTEEMEKLSKKMDEILFMKAEQVTKTTVDYIVKLQELSTAAHKNIKIMRNRGRIIDVFIYLNLALTPIVLGIIFYLLLR